MGKPSEFRKYSLINAPVNEVFAWHERDGALERLSPPWDPIRVIERKGGIKNGATTLLEMKTGPIKYKWLAEHGSYQKDALFRDTQIKGPFALWEHTHRFLRRGENKTLLIDEIKYRLPFHQVSGILLSDIIKKKLFRIFEYRHKTLKNDLELQLHYKCDKPLKIAVTGSSGLVGSSLVPFLKTAGHNVVRFIRHKQGNANQPFWDPERGILNREYLQECDVVIHLSGENISEGRWTPEKRRKIISSRLHTTLMISKAISELEHPPKLFLCASAVGYYGDRGDRSVTERDGHGDDFISDVCNLWEKATRSAAKRGTRVANMRIGVVLTPAGGALGKMLPLFKAGLGARIGSGNQYMSWISIDDLLYAIYHIIMTESIRGPVNLVSPRAVTNDNFGKIMSIVLQKPYRLSIPEAAIEFFLGQPGKELFLSSTRVFPEKLLETGFKFRFPDLLPALEHLLGRPGKRALS